MVATSNHSGSRQTYVEIDNCVDTTKRIFSGTDLTIGRHADFPVGTDDKYMHRRLLRLFDVDGTWYLTNLGERIPVRIVSDHAPNSEIVLAPGDCVVLPVGRVRIVFATTQTEYEILMRVGGTRVTNPHPDDITTDGDLTIGGQIELNSEQEQMMRVFARKLLAYPGSDVSVIPDAKEVADELGWTHDKVNTKLDYLAKKLKRAGVPIHTPHKVSVTQWVVRSGLIR